MLFVLMLLSGVVTSPEGDRAPERVMHTIRGTIKGCSGEHPIRIALIGKDFFENQKPLQGIIRKPSQVKDGKVTYEFRVEPGDYGVTAFEDEDENGKLEMGMFGPSEPSQFYRKFTAWRAPRFEDVRFTVKADVKGADIELD